MHVWVFRDINERFHVMAPAAISWTEVSEEQATSHIYPEPSLKIPWGVWSRLLSAAPEALGKGGPDVQAAVHKAELAALRAHLEDMRTLTLAKFNRKEPR